MNEKPIAALFVTPDSIYKNYGWIDCYDEARDARTFNGSVPVIAHPPCRTWSRLRAFSKGDAAAHELAHLAVMIARSNGGIVEHPASSQLWTNYNLPAPGKLDDWGGFLFTIDQGAFGHPAMKRTTFYIVGCHTTQIPSFGIWSQHWRTVESQHSADRLKTPPQMAQWLITLATEICFNKADKGAK